jgi:hypothetical protein
MTRWWLALLAVFIAVPAFADTIRLGLFIGNNVGLGPDVPLRYAEKEAQDLAHLFQDMGGLRRERSTVLVGQRADVVRDALTSTEGQIAELHAAGHEVLVVLYYSGHASTDGLHLSGSVLPMGVLERWLERSQADIRVAFVDACASGTLARTRGGTPVDGIELAANDALGSTGLAVLTSTGPLSVARESEQFGGGVFSSALFTGLRGAADDNVDGAVSLDEAYRYAFEQTVVQSARGGDSGVQRPEYRTQLEGVGDVILTRQASSAAGMVLGEELEGTYTVVSVASGHVVARVDKEPGIQRRVALSPGRYVVRKVRTSDVLVGELDLAWGGDRWVVEQQMQAVPVGDPLARSGVPEARWTLNVAGLVRTSIANGNPAGGGAQVAVGRRVWPGLWLELSTAWSAGNRYSWTSQLWSESRSASLILLTVRRTPRLDPYIGGGVQALWLVQNLKVQNPDVPNSDLPFRLEAVTPGLTAIGGLRLPLGGRVSLDTRLGAVVYPVNVDRTLGMHATVTASAGITVQLGR